MHGHGHQRPHRVQPRCIQPQPRKMMLEGAALPSGADLPGPGWDKDTGERSRGVGEDTTARQQNHDAPLHPRTRRGVKHR